MIDTFRILAIYAQVAVIEAVKTLSHWWGGGCF